MLSKIMTSVGRASLFTDFYSLTMAKGYWKTGQANTQAEFYVSFRKAPFGGGYIVFSGLSALLEMLAGFKYETPELDFLASLSDRAGKPFFEPDFLDYLQNSFSLDCTIDAVSEGSIIFPQEPVLRVRGSILQAQLIEGLILNTLNFQSLISTKAARICHAAGSKPVVDFGLRRAQGVDGALSATRASYVGGISGTSNVLAANLWNIPVVGTHAHSWVMSFSSELAAFSSYAKIFPDEAVMLIDTYSSAQGIKNAVQVALEMRQRGQQLRGIRIDSGDLAYFSKMARLQLNKAGLHDVKIIASNEIDEYIIESLNLQQAPIDVWGVGTKLVTGDGDSALSGVYKLSAVHDGQRWKSRLKVSEQKIKISLPGPLECYRFFNTDGHMVFDAVLGADEDPSLVQRIINPDDNTHYRCIPDNHYHQKLLQPCFKNGAALIETNLETARDRLNQQLKQLDASHKRLARPHIYVVGLSEKLNQTRDLQIKSMRREERD